MQKLTIVLLFGILLTATPLWGQSLDYEPKILLVTAHPDDDAIFSATVFKTTHLLKGKVDLALMTNGEGGYRYSTLGNFIYNKELDKEEEGRAYLPGIRKQELMSGGEIVGIRNYYFFDQLDESYSEDVAIPMGSWDVDYIRERLKGIITEEAYDFVFTMLPSETTHAHHKASALLALQAVESLPENERPLIFATTIADSAGSEMEYTQLPDYPVTRRMQGEEPLTFDRTKKFGHDDRMDYKIIANWVIAEHKSQGTMQLLMNRGDIEQYWPYDMNKADELTKAADFFEVVNEVPVYQNPNISFDVHR